jgi:hypothetical protein
LTTVVNIKHEACDVKICRGTIFGNPYVIGRDGSREEVIRKYRQWFYQVLKDEYFREALIKLKGKRLGCFCKQPDTEVACHGDIIAAELDSL